LLLLTRGAVTPAIKKRKRTEDSLSELCEQIRTGEVTVVAHVVAHELGHLLTGSPGHSASGLMAEPIDFHLAEQGGLRFHSQQIRWMQRRLVKQEP
jgi:hypothetical protein